MDDANFCNGRLRLAAFLRVVESDMPQRPARFRRRVALTEDNYDDSHAEFEQANVPAATTSAPLDAPEMHLSPLLAPADIDSERPASNKNEKLTDTSHTQSEHGANSGSEYDLPHSPIPNGNGIGYDQDASEDEMNSNERETSQPRTQICRKARVIQSATVKASAGKSRNSASTRKRRLPVSSLALLRTTTSDGGLPEPGVRDFELEHTSTCFVLTRYLGRKQCFHCLSHRARPDPRQPAAYRFRFYQTYCCRRRLCAWYHRNG